MTTRRFFGLFILILAGTAAAGDAPAVDPMAASCAAHMGNAAAADPNQVTASTTEAAGPDGDVVRTILFKNFLIDRIYPSMTGPWTRTYVEETSSKKDELIWMTRYRAEVLDGKSGAASQEFMCHTNLDLVSADSPGQYRYLQSQLSISQGQKEIEFPKGFALAIPLGKSRALDVNAMVLNNNDADIHRQLDFRVTMSYFRDADARARKLSPLFQGAISGFCLTDASTARNGEPVCREASATSNRTDSEGRAATGHWIVPPGRLTLANDVEMPVPYDTTLHYLWMHVHPYAESMALLDTTAGRVVWQGRVENAKNRAAVLSTDHFSSTVGIPVFKDHKYRLVTTYNNTTTHDVDAMAAFWMYFKAREAPFSQETVAQVPSR